MHFQLDPLDYHLRVPDKLLGVWDSKSCPEKPWIFVEKICVDRNAPGVIQKALFKIAAQMHFFIPC